MSHTKQNELYKPVVPIWEEPTPPLPTTIRASQKALKKASSQLAILRQHREQLELLQKPSDGLDSNDPTTGEFTLWLEEAEAGISSTQELCWALDDHVRSLAHESMKGDIIWTALERNNYRLLKQIYIGTILTCVAILATIPYGLVLYAGALIFACCCKVLECQIIKIFWPTTSCSGSNEVFTMPRNAGGPVTEELLA